MSFIPKNPLIAPEVEGSPSIPMVGTRGLFAGKDGWYDVDSNGNEQKITLSVDRANSYKYYGSAGIIPSSQDLFNLETNDETNTAIVSLADASDIDEIVIPYEYKAYGKTYTVRKIANTGFADCKCSRVWIPNTITHIGEHAFAYSNLSRIDIPDSVIEIGNGAFIECRSLTKAIFGDGTTSIPACCFEENVMLSWVEMSDNVTEIGAGAFVGCTSLGNIELSNNLSIISQNAFCRSRLTDIKIPASVTLISQSAFAQVNITNVYYEGSKEQWDNIAFGNGNDNILNATIHYDCVPATKGDIYEAVKDIEIGGGGGDPAIAQEALDTANRALETANEANGIAYSAIDCLTGVSPSVLGDTANEAKSIAEEAKTVTDTIKYYGDVNVIPSDQDLFNFNTNENSRTAKLVSTKGTISGDIIIPCRYTNNNGKTFVVTSIGEWAFAECGDITNIIIPDSITNIERSAFERCDGLVSITIPDSITNINACAFSECVNLENIVIPDTVTSIDDDAFYGCDKLANIYYTSTKEEWDNIAISNNNEYLANVTIHYDYKDVSDINIPLEEGSGENSIQMKDSNAMAMGKNSVALGNNTKALGDNSYSEGIDSLSGCGAFVITMPLSTEINNNVTRWKLDSVSGLSVGDVCSILFMASDGVTVDIWENRGTIAVINKDTNEVFLENSDGTTLYPHKPDNIFAMAFLAVLEKPEIGTVISGHNSRTEGRDTKALGEGAVASGGHTIAVGKYSSARGSHTKALNANAIAEGNTTEARGANSRSDGSGTKAIGGNSYAGGKDTTASGTNSRSVGEDTYAKGNNTVATGKRTVATRDNSFVRGEYNIVDEDKKYLDIVGNGDIIERSNAYTLDEDGNGWFAGDVTVNKDGKKYATLYEVFDTATEANSTANAIKYYGDTDVVPSSQDLFNFTADENTGAATLASTKGTLSGDIVIPYEYTDSNGKTFAVTGIGNDAFKGVGITGIIIPNTVTTIGARAFAQSTISRIDIPDSVITLSQNALQKCNKLTEVTLGNGITAIPDYCFFLSSALSKIEMSDSITKIGVSAFESCSSLTDVKLSNNLSVISQNAFAGCSDLTDIKIPASITKIDNYAFYLATFDDVWYEGTEDQWQNITLGSNNGNISNATIHFETMTSLDEAVKEIASLKEIIRVLQAKSLIRTISINLLASKWIQDGDIQFHQVVDIDDITQYSKVDLQPTTEQIVIFHEKDITFVTENKNGIVTVYCIGQMPILDYTIQATITEVV